MKLCSLTRQSTVFIGVHFCECILNFTHRFIRGYICVLVSFWPTSLEPYNLVSIAYHWNSLGDFLYIAHTYPENLRGCRYTFLGYDTLTYFLNQNSLSFLEQIVKLPCRPLRGRGLMYLLYTKNSTWRWLGAISTPRSEKCHSLFTPRPTKWGRGILASPRMSVRPSGRPSVRPASGCPHFVSGAELSNPCMDFFNFWHTHPLGGVDVPFGVFEILPA